MPGSLRFFLSSLFLPTLLFAGKVNYSVQFVGLQNPEALKTLREVSDLSFLQDKPPASINALRYRADSDIPEILKALHAYGYYEATAKIEIEEASPKVQVFVLIQPGPVYTLDEFTINLSNSDTEKITDCTQIQLKDIGIQLGKPALAKEILKAEEKILDILSRCGYPLAEIEKQEMIADGTHKTFQVHLNVQTHAFSYFGPSRIAGLSTVDPQYIKNKIRWKETQAYNETHVAQTQKTLMDTGLFSSVFITRDPPSLEAHNQLPMKIEVIESKHRSFNAGISYQTFFGPGITVGWEHRNIGGMGRKLSIQGDATRRNHTGAINFLWPDFYHLDQDFTSNAQATNEDIYAYDEKSYSFTNRIERRIGTKYRFSAGVKVERLMVSRSVSNGAFTLLEVPIYFRWSNANDLLDPTKGATLQYTFTPAGNFSALEKYYFTQSFSHTGYLPITSTNTLILAHQLMIDSIFSRNLGSVPVPKRVLGGSEQDLRGYRYRSVSPLRGSKPIGGQSGIFYTFESRFRVAKTLGLVPFFDIGSVYETQLPNFKGKWFKSAGLGIRYYSFIGPIRFDLAFPINRRPEIDPHYRILVSIGQTF